jgi:hypothetical protein
VSTAYPRPPFQGPWRQHLAAICFSLTSYLAFLAVVLLSGDDFMALVLQRITPIIGNWIDAEELVLFWSNVFRWGYTAILVVYGIWHFMHVMQTTWRLDSTRISVHYSSFVHSRDSLRYAEVIGVSLKQSWFGRIFGYGTIKIRHRGSYQPFCIWNAPDAVPLYQFLQELERHNGTVRIADC